MTSYRTAPELKPPVMGSFVADLIRTAPALVPRRHSGGDGNSPFQRHRRPSWTASRVVLGVAAIAAAAVVIVVALGAFGSSSGAGSSGPLSDRLRRRPARAVRRPLSRRRPAGGSSSTPEGYPDSTAGVSTKRGCETRPAFRSGRNVQRRPEGHSLGGCPTDGISGVHRHARAGGRRSGLLRRASPDRNGDETPLVVVVTLALEPTNDLLAGTVEAAHDRSLAGP